MLDIADETEGDLAVQLVQATGAWLNFQSLCKLSNLFNEEYLAYPIGLFFRTRYPELTLVREYSHPHFPGKRRGIDFALLDSDDNLKMVVETKWLSQSHPSWALPRILGDIVKLELSNVRNTVFLAAGKDETFRDLFKRPEFQEIECRRSGGGTFAADKAPLGHGLLPAWNDHRCANFDPSSNYFILSVRDAATKLANRRYYNDFYSDFCDCEIPEEVIVLPIPPCNDDYLPRLTTAEYNVYGWQIHGLPDTKRRTFRLCPPPSGRTVNSGVG